jgi:hypothetical protein
MHRTLQRLAALSALLLCAASQPLSSTETRLVGKWRVTGKSSSTDLMFRPDRSAHIIMRWTSDRRSQTWASDGTWSAKDNRLFLDWFDNPDVVRQMRKEPTKIRWHGSDIIVLSHPKDPSGPTTAHRVK